MLNVSINEVVSDEILDSAFEWLCQRRKNYSHNDDVWVVRQRWAELKARLRTELIQGDYRFSSLRRIHCTGEDLELWSATDSLVLKAIDLVLTEHLVPKLSKRCTHLAGNGGAKAAVREVVRKLPANKFAFRTDVKSYYASIDHEILFDQLRDHISDPRLFDLLWQYMRRTIYDDGVYEDVHRGISLGCPLSPLIGALFLDSLDRKAEALNLCYVRFMDDWVILAPTRWKLRKAITIVNQTLHDLKLKQHPAKTFIGRIESGFDFLGYRFEPRGLSIAPKTIRNFVDRICQLYEQDAAYDRVGEYIRRWLIWVRSGLDDARQSKISQTSAAQ